MRKKIFFAAIAAVVLFACNSDEILQDRNGAVVKSPQSAVEDE